MRANDIVTNLAVLLPQLSDKFTTNVDVQSITRSGTVVMITCKDQHGLKIGNAVTIQGAVTVISSGDLTRAGVVGTIVTDSDHDFSEGTTLTITISGATEAEFNGTFTVLTIPNRQTITFTMVDSGATTATGSPVLEGAENHLRQYNGAFQVASVPSTSVFTVIESNTTMEDPVGTITVRGKPRIATGVNPRRMMEAYTEKKLNEYWLFVALDNVFASKDRTLRTDGVSNRTAGNFWRQQVIEAATLYLFIPAEEDIGAGGARDLAQDEFRSICRSVMGAAFDSGLHAGADGKMQFLTHGVFDYNTAVYVHAFSFGQTVNLYEEDSVGPDQDVAFRNLNFTADADIPGSANTSALTATLNLDDVAL